MAFPVLPVTSLGLQHTRSAASAFKAESPAWIHARRRRYLPGQHGFGLRHRRNRQDRAWRPTSPMPLAAAVSAASTWLFEESPGQIVRNMRVHRPGPRRTGWSRKDLLRFHASRANPLRPGDAPGRSPTRLVNEFQPQVVVHGSGEQSHPSVAAARKRKSMLIRLVGFSQETGRSPRC